MERVSSSNVLDATHEVLAPFRATVLGTFRRVGPNSWDDYEYVRKPGASFATTTGAETLEVLPSIPVQFENRGSEVRLRSVGKVLRVRFLPSKEDEVELSKLVGEAFDARTHARSLRQYFQDKYLRALSQSATLGAAAVIVGKLNGK